MRKALLLAAAVAALGIVTSANAGSVVIPGISGTVTVTTVGPYDNSTFDNNPVGAHTGNSTAIYDNASGPISFTAGADTTGVTIPPATGSAAPPLGDSSHYLWGLVDGTTVTFGAIGGVTSFLINWGSIDSIAGDGYDNVLTLSNGDVVTGTNLGWPTINAPGNGSQTDPANNLWLKISDTKSFTSFTATSARNAFEFDMADAVPEPSTWAMMMLGFAGLGYAAFRRVGKARQALA